jgi:diadenylate cyclase
MDSLFDDIGDAFSGFALQNLLEIAIITIVLFWLLRLLSGTTAMTVVRGIALVALAIIILSRVFDSVVLHWLAGNAVAVLTLFVLIVFQPEFRRAMERVGRAGGLASLLFAPAAQSDRDVVTVLSAAAAAMGARNVGAIVVVERETGLQDVVETGIAVDAEPTAELLEGIFQPGGPLHDGAVVVRGGRVVAASCMLPTAINQQAVDPHLGTRHRAAVGITEQTDAVVVVVSEESGEISVAADGKLHRPLNRRRLENALAALLHGGNGRARRSETAPVRR